MGVINAWCLHFDIGELHNAFQLALYEFDIYSDRNFTEREEHYCLTKQFTSIGATSFFLALRTH